MLKPTAVGRSGTWEFLGIAGGGLVLWSYIGPYEGSFNFGST